jgi:hypothetical protein
MADKKEKPQNLNIEKNIKGKKFIHEVKNGATIPKPPTSLTPKDQSETKKNEN